MLLKNILLIFLYDGKIIKTPSPVRGRKCPVTILLLKLHYENKIKCLIEIKRKQYDFL